MKKKYFVSLVWAIFVCFSLCAQTPLYDSTRVYDTVTDADPWYFFSSPKPCIEPTTYEFAPGHILVQEYVTSNILTVYGVALTLKDQLNREIYQSDTIIQAILLTPAGPTANTTLGGLYTMNLVDSVTMQSVDMTTNFGRSPKSAQSFPEILQEAEKQEVFKLDSARKPPHVCSSEFDPNVYCQYHQVLGHHTEDCLELQYAIQNFIDDCKMTAEARGSSTENSHG